LYYLLLNNFYRVHRLSAWGRRRFTPAGMLILGGLLAASVFGVDTRQTMAFQIAAVLFALLLVAIISAPSFRARLRLRRCLPQVATVGESCRYQLEITVVGHGRQTGLQLTDILHELPPTLTEMVAARKTEDQTRNRFDRIIGFPRWLRLLERKRGGNIEAIELPALEAAQTTRVSLSFTPLRRGYLDFSEALIQRPDPLGLFNAILRQPLKNRLLVLPRRYALRPLQLTGGRSYQPGGLEQASSVGDAEEFISLRDYRPGDPLRRIHWKSWARTGHPVVREYQDEYFIRQGLLLDTFLEQRPDTLFEEAVSVAASYACMERSSDSLLDLLFAGASAHIFTSGRGLADTRALLEVLACVETSPEDPFARLQALLGMHAPRLSACICVLLDWDERRQALVRLLRGLNLCVHVIVLRSPGTAQPTAATMADRPEHFEVLTVGAIGAGSVSPAKAAMPLAQPG